MFRGLTAEATDGQILAIYEILSYRIEQISNAVSFSIAVLVLA